MSRKIIGYSLVRFQGSDGNGAAKIFRVIFMRNAHAIGKVNHLSLDRQLFGG